MSRSILSPVLTLGDWSGSFTHEATNGTAWDICKDHLRYYFDVPKGAKQIQFRAFDEPGPGRTKMTLVHFSKIKVGSGVYIDDGAGGTCREYLMSETQDAIKKLAGRRKTWYVDVYYWE